MSNLSLIHTGIKRRPHFIGLYGVGGVGKSSFAACAPRPIFIGTDDGVGALDVASFPVPETWQQALSYFDTLLNERHDYETAVLDTVNGLEPLLWSHLCRESKCNSIEEVDGGYGKGYLRALEKWVSLFNTLKKLRNKMNVIVLGHARVRTTEDPCLNEKYDRFSLKMDQAAAAVVHESVDCMLFATHLIETSKVKGARKVHATGDGKRVMFTEERPAYMAKSRFDLPFQMDLSWDEFEKGIAATVPRAGVDDMAKVFEGIEEVGIRFLISTGWLLEGQQLADIPATKRKVIMGRRDKFIAAVKNFASEEQTPTPTTEENE